MSSINDVYDLSFLDVICIVSWIRQFFSRYFGEAKRLLSEYRLLRKIEHSLCKSSHFIALCVSYSSDEINDVNPSWYRNFRKYRALYITFSINVD